MNKEREDCHEFQERELVQNLGFQNLKQKPKYILKNVKEKHDTHFRDDKNCKRDRKIVKRIFKYQDELPNANFERKITGREYSKKK